MDAPTSADVLGFIGSPDEPDTAALDRCVAAAVAFVTRYKGDPAEWTNDTELGCIMQAAGLFRRRNTPGGIDTFGESAMYTRAVDSEVERLLRIGRYAMPRVG